MCRARSPHTASGNYSACASVVNCRVPVPVTGGSIFPASVTPDTETWQRLVDGQTSTVTSPSIGLGVRTTAAVKPFITLALNAAYNVGACALSGMHAFMG